MSFRRPKGGRISGASTLCYRDSSLTLWMTKCFSTLLAPKLTQNQFIGRNAFFIISHLYISFFRIKFIALQCFSYRDVYGVCYIPLYTFVSTIGVLCCYTYRRGLSRRCSFRLLWAMRRPRSIGRVTGTDSPPFSFYMSNYFFLFWTVRFWGVCWIHTLKIWVNLDL